MMSPSGKQLLATACGATALAIALLLALRQKVQDDTPKEASVPSTETTADASVSRKSKIPRHSETARRRQRATVGDITSGVTMLPMAEVPGTLPPVTGFVIDNYENWTTIPQHYQYDGLALRDGAITLDGDPSSTSSRFGELVSPPLPLHYPAMAAPVPEPQVIPEGASLSVEISLSADGDTWSSWIALEKFRPPDGKRVTPKLQASLSESDVRSYASTTSGTATNPGPAIRYRLNLSAAGVAAPSIRDIRIWKRETQ